MSNVGAIDVGLHSAQFMSEMEQNIDFVSHSQYTAYGADHSSMSCLNVSSSFPLLSRQIEVWAVYNLTFVLLSFKLLHSTTAVPFIVLAIYSLRSGTLKPVSGDATRVCAGCGKMYMKHYMPSQAMKDVRSHTDLLFNVILCGGCIICVAT